MSLSDLAPKLSGALRAEVVREALDAIMDEEEDWAKAQALPVLVPELSPDLLPEAIKAIKDIQSEGHRTIALTVLVAELPEVIPEVFTAARNTRSDGIRTSVLAALAPKLPPERLLEALAIANSIREECDRITVLIALAAPISKLPKNDLSSLWPAAFHSLSSQSQPDFLRSVLALAAVIHALEDRETVAGIIAAVQETEPLGSLPIDHIEIAETKDLQRPEIGPQPKKERSRLP